MYKPKNMDLYTYIKTQYILPEFVPDEYKDSSYCRITIGRKKIFFYDSEYNYLGKVNVIS